MGLLDGMFGSSMDDPKTQAILALGAGLLSGRGNFGQVVGQAIPGAVGAYQMGQDRIAQNRQRQMQEEMQRAQIAKLQADAARMAQMRASGIDPEDPADIRSARMFMQMTPEEQRQALTWKRADNVIRDINGVATRASLSGLGPQTPLTTLSQEASAQATIAGAKQRAQEVERARYDLVEGVDPASGRLTFAPRLSMVPGARPPGLPSPNAQIAAPTVPGAPPPASTPPTIEPTKQREIDSDARKTRRGAEMAVAKAEQVIGHIDSALNQTNPLTAGAVGNVLGRIPGTPATDLRAVLTTIKANLGFQELQAMRDASPTGGALGQVAVQELESLQSTIASLDPNQSPEQLRRGLNQVKFHFNNWKQVMQRAAGQQQQAPVDSSLIDAARAELERRRNGR